VAERNRAAEEKERLRTRRERAEFELGWRRWEERNGREVSEEEYRRQLRREKEQREGELRARRAGSSAAFGGDSGGG
jgi:hypothetical protein